MTENTKQGPWIDRLLDLVNKFLDFQNAPIDQSPIRAEARAITAEFLDFLKNMYRPGVYSPKALAEIEEIHSRIQKSSAQLEKIHTETNTKAINNRILDFRLALAGIRFGILISKEKGTEPLIKEIDKFEILLSECQPPTTTADPAPTPDPI